MRYAAAIVMFGLALAVAFVPHAGPPASGDTPGEEPAPVSICPVVEAGGRATDISILSPLEEGEGRLSTFSVGIETGAVDFTTGDTGSVTLAAADADAIGVAGALVEMPSEATASGVVISGPESLAAEACADVPAGQVFVSGGSTASGEGFEVQLVNPYAGDATVNLRVTSDGGIESTDQFNAVIVPALSSVALDMTQIIPGREDISASIEIVRGAVLAFGRQTIDGETALWRAVEPGMDWWLPVPPGEGTKQLRVATPDGTEIDYQVDFYGSEGVEEAHDTGTIDPRGQVQVSLSEETSDAAGVRVIATGPVVASLWVDSAEGLASTTGSQVEAPVWLLPGAGAPDEGTGSVVILNTGLDTVSVSVIPLGGNTEPGEFELEAEEVLVVETESADGYRVEASGPVVALWTSQLEGAGSAAIGIPVQDG